MNFADDHAIQSLIHRYALCARYFIERRELVDQFGELSHHLTQPYSEADTR